MNMKYEYEIKSSSGEFYVFNVCLQMLMRFHPPLRCCSRLLRLPHLWDTPSTGPPPSPSTSARCLLEAAGDLLGQTGAGAAGAAAEAVAGTEETAGEEVVEVVAMAAAAEESAPPATAAMGVTEAGAALTAVVIAGAAAAGGEAAAAVVELMTGHPRGRHAVVAAVGMDLAAVAAVHPLGVVLTGVSTMPAVMTVTLSQAPLRPRS